MHAPSRILVVFLMLAFFSVHVPAMAISCGSEPAGTRFDAVCGLAPRAWNPDETWYPEGSGVLVAPNLIVTIRHFIAGPEAPATGACDVGVSPATEWYAYFRGCPDPGNNPPCLNLCVGPDEDMIRVRIKCFTLATGEFTFPPLPLNDGVVVAEIEPADVCFVAHIAPIPVVRPNDAGVDLW